ncbi:uncharacterized protein LOC131043965 isoform X2 [Cryptomeria japonica]|uniref:uncharacterized protein LOC131043965 isoform X2 n=1 Tax=Cryptomeria japonica TaxID=3369 RepID=UPI0025ACE501|nr:uncharacterized protein LOC131043965 isoform X2 [Cryptomeria japonica]
MEASSSSSSLVSKAKTALHSAAAKAERVIADFGRNTESETKAEVPGTTAIDATLDTQNQFVEYDESSQNVRFRSIPKKVREQEFWRRYFAREGKQTVLEKDKKQDSFLAPQYLNEMSLQNESVAYLEMESPQKDPAEEDAYVKAFAMVSVPSTLVVRQLASATDFASIKILSVLDKDERLRSQQSADRANHSLLWSLFETDRQYSQKKCNDASLLSSKAHFLSDNHGAPPGSFLVQLAEIIAGIKSVQKMALFWLQVVGELRKLWEEGQPIPLLPVNDNPDLRYCLLHQQLQVINCCISRKKRRIAALKLVDTRNVQDDCKSEELATCPVQEAWEEKLNTIAPALYAKTKSGKLVPRLGVLHAAEKLVMLETSEPVFSPITQEGPILTEDLIRETEELILRTGSVGAGCSQLFSDMQAFKAANPGCILEDFVRWYSPPDWKEETCNLSDGANDNDKGSSRRGYLSKRMQAKGNLWCELWESAKPIPAAKQTPLFDEDLAGESTLSYLEDIAPSDLFEQLFIVALSSGFAIAEAAPAAKKDNVSRWFKECKQYVISTCCRGMDIDTLEHLCEVYETMEAIVVHPHEDIFNEVCESTNVEALVAEIPKGRLQKFGIHNVHLPNFEKHVFRKNLQEKEQIDKDDNHHNFFSRLIEGKNSLFGKKSQKPTSTGQNKKLGMSENEWTIL